MFIRNAAAIIFYIDKRVVLQERGSHSKLGEEWGFFGGKIEKGENSKEAIVREIKEELDYDLKNFDFLGRFEYLPYKEWQINVEVYIAPLPVKKELKLKEGKSYKLFDINETKKLKMVPGDHIVLEAANNYLNKTGYKK